MTPQARIGLTCFGAALILLTSPLAAQEPAQEPEVRSAPMRRIEQGPELRPKSVPPLVALGKAVTAPLAELRAAREVAKPELENLALWNLSGGQPKRNGLARPLLAPRVVSFDASLWSKDAGTHAGGVFAKRADQSLAWGASVKVAGAYRARLHLAEVNLPAGAELWVVGDGETVGPFGLELRDDSGGLWTPSVAGETVRLEVKLPAGSGADSGFVLDQVLEVVGADPVAPDLVEKAGQCLVDSKCVSEATFPQIDNAREAVAHLEFVDVCPPGVVGNCGYICTGGLVSQGGDPDFYPPFLITANHCFSTQKAAASLEAFFDFVTPRCNGPAPALGSLPRSNGSTLQVSQDSTDVTLVLLNSVPRPRHFLGWDTATVAHDTELHRLSHPCDPNVTNTCRPLPQKYSKSHADLNALTCSAATRPAFLYQTYRPEDGDMGGTFGGSSGAPAILADGRLVGQLLGGCGTNPQNGCDYESNSEVDGAFRFSYPMLAKFVDPLPSTCVPDAFTACLVGGRFKVTFDYRTPQGGPSRGRVATAGTDNSALFYFNNPSNWEMLVKVLDGCPVNQKKWVFYAATTNVDFTLAVTDTATGHSKAYANSQGQAAAPVQDTGAFDYCP